jgi:hypothetical protein
MDSAEYERMTAAVTHAVIQRCITCVFPELQPSDHIAMIVNVIDRLARMYGWSIKREYAMNEDGE